MATIEPIEQSQQPMSDDQELAKVLAGIDQTPEPPVEEPVVATPSVDEPVADPVVVPQTDDLIVVKQEAITELRPLIDKLNVPAEEKFDTYLLLLRSTDDKTLIEPAHETAKLIEDESRRAQALLDIIKEIDFLSASK